MEIKIGIQMAPRELVVDSAMSAEDLARTFSDALADGSLLRLQDRKGDVVLVPAAKIAYLEVGIAGPRRVGFGAS